MRFLPAAVAASNSYCALLAGSAPHDTDFEFRLFGAAIKCGHGSVQSCPVCGGFVSSHGTLSCSTPVWNFWTKIFFMHHENLEFLFPSS